MSIILGLKDDYGVVHCMADTSCTIGETMKVKTTQKLFIDPDKEFIVGGVGEGRFTDFLRYTVYPKKDKEMTPHEYMVWKFIPRLKEEVVPLLDEHGGEDCNHYTFMVAFGSSLFTVHNDFALLEHEKYMAIGMGQEAGVVALNIINKPWFFSEKTSEAKLMLVMNAVVEHVNYVAAPYIYFSTKQLGEV